MSSKTGQKADSWLVLVFLQELKHCLTLFPRQEPLNSGDDVSDEEDQELFDTENVVVCQYDKVRNKTQSACVCITTTTQAPHF